LFKCVAQPSPFFIGVFEGLLKGIRIGRKKMLAMIKKHMLFIPIPSEEQVKLTVVFG
jgi:hypothetical protein